jgi:hypothetical protein
MNDHWKVLYQVCFLCRSEIQDGHHTAGHTFNTDYMGKYRNILLSKTTELIEPKLYMDVHWMVLYKITVFRSSLIYKISTWPPGQIMCSDWLKFQSSSSLKLMNWLNPNCTWMIIGRSFTKLLFFFYVNLKSKMAAYAGHSFNTVPYWKI